jgi:hypothetical protein
MSDNIISTQLTKELLDFHKQMDNINSNLRRQQELGIEIKKLERDFKKKLEEPQSVTIRFCKNGPKEMYFKNPYSNDFTLGVSAPDSWTFGEKTETREYDTNNEN